VKNHELLFDALVRLTERMTPAPHVIVVGSGEREAELRMYVVDRELDRSVHWLGWRKDLPDLFPAFDVTALPSLDEGTPVSLLESLASGTPVVSRAVGGVAEILEDGALGSLVWGPSVDEFADALEKALRSPPDARAVERTRRPVLERYSVQRLAEDMEGLYADLLVRAGLGRPEVTRTS
jgi:glycosyltransferase involved in cell wall biosynthesis